MSQLDVAELEPNENDKEQENSSGADKQPSKVKSDFPTPINEVLVRFSRVL
jgi:hypothetical protein